MFVEANTISYYVYERNEKVATGLLDTGEAFEFDFERYGKVRLYLKAVHGGILPSATVEITASGCIPEALYKTGVMDGGHSQAVYGTGTFITVDDDGPAANSTIQAAINAAKAGDRLLVYPGTYTENVYVNKEVEILSWTGNPEDTIVQAEDPNYDVFYVPSDNVTISGFLIRGTGSASGVYFDGSGNTVIKNNKISDNTNGVFLLDSSNNKIENNIISNNSKGLELHHSSTDNHIYLNEFLNNDLNVLNGLPNFWNSPERIAYEYRGSTFFNYPGNFYSDYTGSD